MGVSMGEWEAIESALGNHEGARKVQFKGTVYLTFSECV